MDGSEVMQQPMKERYARSRSEYNGRIVFGFDLGFMAKKVLRIVHA